MTVRDYSDPPGILTIELLYSDCNCTSLLLFVKDHLKLHLTCEATDVVEISTATLPEPPCH